jgi:poly-gamma-glutamate synthesis protein (capsule biosynthesis protein)
VRLFRVAVVLGVVSSTGVSAHGLGAQELPPERGFPAELELATTVEDGFTIAVVGDIIIANPQSMNPDPGFQAVLQILQDADVVTGNFEGNIIDGRTFAGSGPGGFAGTPAVAADLKAMGFDIVARSNNHAGEYGYEGHLETNRWLDEAGVVYAGSGENYWAARAARFVDTPMGRVGMVATASSFPSTMMATPARGEWPGRGGASALRTTRYFMSPNYLWPAVEAIRQAFPNGTGFYARGINTEDDIQVNGEQFRRAPEADEPYYSFDINQRDLTDILRSVREGKMRSDLITVAIHAHQFHDAQGGYRGPGIEEAEHLDTNPSIADFLEVFAKAVIDGGADVFQGTGVHALRGIEIYKDRPIFYGLGEFFRQMDIIGLSGMRDELARSVGPPGAPFPVKYESIIAVSEFEDGKLSEVRLHPIELTYEVRMAQRGLPRIASPEAAQRILTRLQELSEPLGTTIRIEGGVGYIRP